MDPDSDTTRDTAGTTRDVPPTTERAEGEGSVTMASRPSSSGGLDPADRDAPLPSPAERGRTTIHPRVLTVVARSAALSVPGSIRHTSGLGRIAGRAYPHAEVRSQHTAVDAQIQVDLAWPSPVTARAAEVRDAVGPDIELILDSGIMSGGDIAAALCAGADFTLIGRAYMYGLMAGGRAGVQRALDILAEELRVVTTLLGVSSVAELGPQHARMHWRGPQARPIARP